MSRLCVLCRVLFILVFSGWMTSAQSQELSPIKVGFSHKPSGNLLVTRFNEHDVIVTLSSIEWGTPDRWSFTSRFFHQFDTKNRNQRKDHHSAIIALSPGISGMRLGLGYQGIFTLFKEVGIMTEVRGVLLRTWWHPLIAETRQTYAGAEVRCSFAALLNGSVGYYLPLSTAEGRQAFWGFHVGVGM
ncbi:MAG: hypothetical protein EHM72_06760 [Calditrichaeota bacterium]|nr:MAG: hypothetical protein EHM72_06760 [Calditrichota bacterium]